MRVTILAIGSRGDVQPCVALGVGLQRAGHQVRVATVDDFEALVSERGLDCYPLGVQARQLLRSPGATAILESGSNVLRGMRQIVRTVRPLMEQIMAGTWRACQDAEAILFSTLGMGAYHVAEKLGVPCLWTHIFPIFVQTRCQPSIAFPALPLGGSYNRLTHILVEQFGQWLTAGFVNRWRRERLGLPSLSPFRWPYGQLDGRPLPTFYGYSPAVAPKPHDWGEHVHVTGYWFLDRPPGWQPPADLARFIASGPPPVYAGFGSMSNRDPQGTTRIVLRALEASGQRGVIASGWGGLRDAATDDVFALASVPHDWLFPHVAAVVHHGGAGTTGAGLRAGVPSVIVPHFGDQPFWARRVHELGVGPRPVPRARLTAERLAAAIREAVEDASMRARAAALGARIRGEDGVGNAVRAFERAVERWK
jgi:sterol 3beta-glucosyltransferase